MRINIDNPCMETAVGSPQYTPPCHLGHARQVQRVGVEEDQTSDLNLGLSNQSNKEVV